jgi:hypothetical protein
MEIRKRRKKIGRERDVSVNSILKKDRENFEVESRE